MLVAQDSRVGQRVQHENLLARYGSLVHLHQAEDLATKEELNSTLWGMRTEMQAMEARRNQRVQLVETEVLKMQGVIKDKEASITASDG